MFIVINNQAIDISHLAPTRRQVNLTLPGNITKTVPVEFHFSCHCYSRLPSNDEPIPLGALIPDGSVKHPRDRVFDQLRYDLSLKLMAHIDKIVAEDALVTKSKHNNFFHLSVDEIDVGGTRATMNYYVFMSARKVAEPCQPKMIKIFVETAYPDISGDPAIKGGASRSFGAMLGEYWAPSKR